MIEILRGLTFGGNFEQAVERIKAVLIEFFGGNSGAPALPNGKTICAVARK